MKRRSRNALLVLVLLAAVSMLQGQYLAAQTFNVVCSLSPFDDGPPDVLLSSNTLYWATPGNRLGLFGHVGSVFKVNTDGSGALRLYNFDYTVGDGYFPLGGIILSSNTLYGTTAQGGSAGKGTVFKLNADGTGYQLIYQFTGGADGSAPYSGLVVSGDTLFGTSRQGGSAGNGTVFKLNTDGTAFTTLYSFSGSGGFTVTNNDGAYPESQLLLSGSTLYGTTTTGGTGGRGTVFAINTDGTGFTNLHSFAPLDPAIGTNSDGASPATSLIVSGNTLYGTAISGGAGNNGTVFKLNIDGTVFTVLHTFATATSRNGDYAPINSDGAGPTARLFLTGDTLYGTANAGGDWGYGTAFALKTDGTGFRLLKTFAGPYEGGDYPTSGFTPSGNILYGALNKGAPSGNGAGILYSLSLTTPPLSINNSAHAVILTWPTNYGGFDYTGCCLQSTTNLGSPAWTSNLPAPVAINGLNTVSNPASATCQFFRLVP